MKNTPIFSFISGDCAMFLHSILGWQPHHYLDICPRAPINEGGVIDSKRRKTPP